MPINYFLKEFNIILKEYEMLQAKEEKFNIFSTLHKWHDERRLHSRFLATLLQPNGTHGQSSLFLEEFLNILGIDFPIDKNTKNIF